MPKYRLYADGMVIHEDDFAEYDEGGSEPFHDDYEEWIVPTGYEDVMYWDCPKEIREHIREHSVVNGYPG